jgi:chemotaxis protein CheC
MLTEEHRDVLTELVNIGVGRAAYTLSEMVDSRVALGVPSIVVSELGGGTWLEERAGVPLTAVSLRFGGKLSGVGLLILPRESARSLVAVLTGAPSESAEVEAEREGVITEVGNIVVNSVLGSLGNLTHLDVAFSLPAYREGLVEQVVPRIVPSSSVAASVLFDIRSHAVEGRVVVVFEESSLDEMWHSIDPCLVEPARSSIASGPTG